MENIYVYLHTKDRPLFPKNFYIPAFTNYTLIGEFSFEELFHGDDTNPKYVENIFFQRTNDETSLMVKNRQIQKLRGSVNFGIIYLNEDASWLSDYQLKTKPTKPILSDDINLELKNHPLNRIKQLTLYCSDSAKIQTRFTFIKQMPNLEKLMLIDLPYFQLPEPVDILDLHIHNS